MFVKGQSGNPKGKPLGAVGKEKKAQQKAFEELKNTILRSQKSLLNVQMGIAKGSYIILKMRKGGKKPERVVDSKEIIHFMEVQENGFYIDSEESSYFYISQVDGDIRAIDSMLDRVHGKARQNIGLDGGEDDKPIAIKQVEQELKDWANRK